MEISKETYQKFRAADNSYAQFFDTWKHNSETVGFCSMMRTIYFWRPALAAARVVLMATAIAVVGAAWYHFSTEIIFGVVEIALFVLVIWLLKLTSTALGFKSYFETEDMPLIFQWVKASYDKVCPLVPLGGFLAEEQAARKAAREEATCEE